MDAEIIAKDDRTNLGFLEIEGKASDAVAEIKHLIEHRVSKPLNLGHAVRAFAHDANILLVHQRFHAADLCFNFLQ